MNEKIIKELKEIKSQLEYIKENMISIDLLLQPEEDLEVFFGLEDY